MGTPPLFKVTYADCLQQIILLQRTDYSIFITDYHNRGLWSLMTLSSIRSPLRDNVWYRCTERWFIIELGW